MMAPRLRQFALTAHVTFSVGWLGAVAAYLALAVTGLTSRDDQMVRSAYLSMELIGWLIIVPCSIASLLTGLVQALGTEWGLFRHYWVLVKFLLTVGATTVLLLHVPAVSRMAGVAAETTSSGAELMTPRLQLVVHAGGGLLVLLAATTLSVYKPWGRIRDGSRKPHERGRGSPPITPPLMTRQRRGDTLATDLPADPNTNVAIVGSDSRNPKTQRWIRVLVIIVIGLVLLVVFLHLTGEGPRGH